MKRKLKLREELGELLDWLERGCRCKGKNKKITAKMEEKGKEMKRSAVRLNFGVYNIKLYRET